MNDLIRRQDVINALQDFDACVATDSESPYFCFNEAEKIINKIPTASKIAYWLKTDIYCVRSGCYLVRCSSCCYLNKEESNYCPNCGSEMIKHKEE